MPLTLNPFTNRGPVRTRDDFFGRKDELEAIVSRLRTMQSVSVVGERRIGKSSLLYQLALTGSERLEDECYRFVYFSLQDAHFQTLTGFCATVLRKLGLNGRVIVDGHSAAANLVAFTDELETLTAAGERVVLCLDEFETTFKQREQFGDGFFEHLRSQLELCKFAFITATRESLQQLRLDGKLTSPFDNIFTKVALGDFTEAEAAEFIAYYDTLVNFSEAERRFIASHFDPHPLRLRILCDQVLTNRRRQLAEWALAEEVGKAYSDFFAEKSDEYLSKVKRTASLDNIGKFLGLVKQARDLFTGKGEDKK